MSRDPNLVAPASGATGGRTAGRRGRRAWGAAGGATVRAHGPERRLPGPRGSEKGAACVTVGVKRNAERVSSGALGPHLYGRPLPPVPLSLHHLYQLYLSHKKETRCLRAGLLLGAPLLGFPRPAALCCARRWKPVRCTLSTPWKHPRWRMPRCFQDVRVWADQAGLKLSYAVVGGMST